MFANLGFFAFSCTHSRWQCVGHKEKKIATTDPPDTERTKTGLTRLTDDVAVANTSTTVHTEESATAAAEDQPQMERHEASHQHQLKTLPAQQQHHQFSSVMQQFRRNAASIASQNEMDEDKCRVSMLS